MSLDCNLSFHLNYCLSSGDLHVFALIPSIVKSLILLLCLNLILGIMKKISDLERSLMKQSRM